MLKTVQTMGGSSLFCVENGVLMHSGAFNTRRSVRTRLAGTCDFHENERSVRHRARSRRIAGVPRAFFEKTRAQETRLSSTTGRWLLPSKNAMASVSLVPRRPSTFAWGAAHGLPRGYRERGSSLGLRLAGRRPS